MKQMEKKTHIPLLLSNEFFVQHLGLCLFELRKMAF